MKSEDKQKIMETMMTGMMNSIDKKDKKAIMSQIIPEMMMNFIAEISSEDMLEVMHEMMPRMMENFLTEMNKEERDKMLNFSQTMLREMEGRFLEK